MIKIANKISIIGGSGSGKTTLANNLAKELNLPLYHLDGIHHLENWQIRDKTERDKIILDKVSEEKWIIDGTYRSTLKARLERSDFIIYLDYSSIAQAKGVLSRYFNLKGKERPEIPGCEERISFDYFVWVLKWRRNRRNDIIESLKDIDKNKILVFKNRKKLNKWYSKEFNKKLVV